MSPTSSMLAHREEATDAPAPPAPVGSADHYFSLTARGSSWSREILAGTSTFLALSYIVVVNPAILTQAGIPHQAAFFATALISGLATIVMGLWGRLPFAVAPGMEMNAIVAFSVVGTLHYTWSQALGMVFWSGVAMLAVSAFRLREFVIDAIPGLVRIALTASVGVFIGLIGLQISGIATTSGGHLSGIGSLASPPAYALYIGLAVALLLDRFGARPAAVLSSIAAAATYCSTANVASGTDGAATGGSFAALFKLDLGIITDPRAWSLILVLFALDFFGSIAKVVGLTTSTPLQRDGRVPGMPQALLTDAGATIAGAAVGSSSFVVFVESAVGIRAGARTGIAATVTGTLLLCCLILSPVLTYVPVQATTGTLVFVAIKMLISGLSPRTERFGVALVAVAIAVTIITLAIDQAMAAAFIVCLIADAYRRKRPHPVLIVATVLLTASAILQHIHQN